MVKACITDVDVQEAFVQFRVSFLGGTTCLLLGLNKPDFMAHSVQPGICVNMQMPFIQLNSLVYRFFPTQLSVKWDKSALTIFT